MGDSSDMVDWFGEDFEQLSSENVGRIPAPKTVKLHTKSTNPTQRAAKMFAENLGPWFEVTSLKGNAQAGYTLKMTGDLRKMGPAGITDEYVKQLAREAGGSDTSLYGGPHGAYRYLRVAFYPDVVHQHQPKKQGIKIMNEDTEFYLALLQASGVKMVSVRLDKSKYNYLCAIDVNVGDSVVVQARNMMMVGELIEVLEEWNMDLVEEFGDQFRWVITKVDVSNVKVYEDQKKQVFRELRQARLVEKAKTFAGNSNIDFNALVTKTQNSLAIEHHTNAVDVKAAEAYPDARSAGASNSA